MLLETCANEFESHIKGLFKNPRMLTKTLAEIPVVGGLFIPDLMEDYTPFLLQVCKALCCRERFAQDVPGWPILPLHERDIEAAIENDDDPPCRLLGYYGRSLAGADWDYDGHPRFSTFASGLLAYKHTPIEVRTDPHLLAKFPPLPLTGLTDGDLYWRSPERITEDRHEHAWCYEMGARLEEGIPMQALDEWVREQVPMFVGCC
jgi:hypothetical protein